MKNKKNYYIKVITNMYIFNIIQSKLHAYLLSIEKLIAIIYV